MKTHSQLQNRFRFDEPESRRTTAQIARQNGSDGRPLEESSKKSWEGAKRFGRSPQHAASAVVGIIGLRKINVCVLADRQNC
jgi:hypothetical protein